MKVGTPIEILPFINSLLSCNCFSPSIKKLYAFSTYTNNDLGKTVHFEPYTFKGFSPPGYKDKPSPTGISLEGVTISRYAGDYNKDTYEYRMAKMLSECEDHLVMDSVMFHYLYIERHTMIDNVSKTTSVSTYLLGC